MNASLEGKWALILGASSGFGEAVSVELARYKVNIFGVHLDRKATLSNVDRIQEKIKQSGAQSRFFNINAADVGKREETLDKMAEIAAPGDLRILLHSLAFGTLRRYFDPNGKSIAAGQMDMTLDVMAHSLVYWTQGVVERGLMQEDGRIFAMTSAGGHRVWPTYGPVSAAKAALESHVRQIALELAPKKITANAIQAGVTDTPALRKIPGHEEMVENARQANPGGRLTTPEDVARALVPLSHPGTRWLTGNVVRVDGGEDITG